MLKILNFIFFIIKNSLEKGHKDEKINVQENAAEQVLLQWR